MKNDKKSYQVRINKQAFEYLENILLPAIQATRSNVTKTDVASEALLAVPLPELPAQSKPIRRTRKAVTAPQVSALSAA